MVETDGHVGELPKRVDDLGVADNTIVYPKTPVGVWRGNFLKLRVPMLYNLRADPFERATGSQL